MPGAEATKGTEGAFEPFVAPGEGIIGNIFSEWDEVISPRPRSGSAATAVGQSASTSVSLASGSVDCSRVVPSAKVSRQDLCGKFGSSRVSFVGVRGFISNAACSSKIFFDMPPPGATKGTKVPKLFFGMPASGATKVTKAPFVSFVAP